MRPLGYTTLEESKQLIKCGLDKNTADMVYSDGYEYPDVLVNSWNECFSATSGRVEEDHTPCWSLGALVKQLPHMVNFYGFPLYLNMSKDSVAYSVKEFDKGECLIESVIDALLWVLQKRR